VKKQRGWFTPEKVSTLEKSDYSVKGSS